MWRAYGKNRFLILRYFHTSKMKKHCSFSKVCLWVTQTVNDAAAQETSPRERIRRFEVHASFAEDLRNLAANA